MQAIDEGTRGGNEADAPHHRLLRWAGPLGLVLALAGFATALLAPLGSVSGEATDATPAVTRPAPWRMQ